jgi:hypothetical protein
MFNPVIVVAIIVQAIIAKFSRIAGAILGYVITTGILLWGISLYAGGDQIALFGIRLSEPIFLLVCLVWYGFDTKEFMDARKTGRNAAAKSSDAVPPETGTANVEHFEGLSPEAQSLSQETQTEKQGVFNGDNNVTLAIHWEGMFMAFDREIQIWLDGVLAGSGSFNQGFNLQIRTTEGVHTISLNQKGTNPNITIHVEKNKNYRVDLDYNRFTSKYKLTCEEVVI